MRVDPINESSMGKLLLLEKAKVEGIRGYDVYRREGGYAEDNEYFGELANI